MLAPVHWFKATNSPAERPPPCCPPWAPKAWQCTRPHPAEQKSGPGSSSQAAQQMTINSSAWCWEAALTAQNHPRVRRLRALNTLQHCPAHSRLTRRMREGKMDVYRDPMP